jgi:hypothetical protein
VTLDDAKFENIEKKIADIQEKIDAGLMNPGVRGDLACDALRAARSEIFKLREIIQSSVEIEPNLGPERPTAA